MEPSPRPLFITVRKAKRLLGIDRPLERAIAAGEIPIVRRGGWRRVRLENVLRWAEASPGDASGAP